MVSKTETSTRYPTVFGTTRLDLGEDYPFTTTTSIRSVPYEGGRTLVQSPQDLYASVLGGGGPGESKHYATMMVSVYYSLDIPNIPIEQ